MNKPLDIVYCKDCRSCTIKKINSQSILYSCNKDNCVDPFRPELYCNKKCFNKKRFKKIKSKES